MNTIFESLKEFNFPSSEQLKEMTLYDSAFRQRTRHIYTEGKNFSVSLKESESSTWSFTSIEKNFQVVQKACAKLGGGTEKRVQCNAYLTPPGCQGLPVHYDLHDVLVFQMEGSKNWKIWPAFRKYVSEETLLYDEALNLPNWTQNSPLRNFQLLPGQWIYLPAGQPHECYSAEESSLHFSFGIYND